MSAVGAASGLAFLVSLAATPVVRRLALWCGATDIPDARRIHTRPTARAGGVAVLLAAVVAIAIYGQVPARLTPGVLAGAALLLAVGLVDDIRSLRAETKLLMQMVAAGLAVAGGIRFDLFGSAVSVPLATVDAVVTFAWIVLITNAFNLSDGLDGLASGIAIAACLALGATALRGGDLAAAATALALVGALLGFLVYNFNPASIFLGDAGSLVLGYALATLPLVGSGGAPLPPVAAFLLVALPATDTGVAIARRFLSRSLRVWSDGPFWRGLRDGLKNTVAPDRRHIHHRLLDLGLTQRRAVCVMYLATGTSSTLAYLVAGSTAWPLDLLALGMAIAVVAVVQTLGFDELRPARSGLALPVLHRLARRGYLVVALDFILVSAAYLAAVALTGRPGVARLDLAAGAAIMAAAQLALFAGLGMYRTSWAATDATGFGLLLRATVSGAVAGYIALRVCALPVTGTTAVVYHFLLLSALTMMRFSLVLLAHAVRATPQSERALICGTAVEARQALRRLRRRGARTLEPIGFVELQPRRQGRTLGRLPVLGTLDALGGIVRSEHVQHLVIADTSLRGEALDWVRAVCREHEVQVHRYVERLVRYDGRVVTPSDMTRARPAGPRTRADGREPVRGPRRSGDGRAETARHPETSKRGIEGGPPWN